MHSAYNIMICCSQFCSVLQDLPKRSSLFDGFIGLQTEWRHLAGSAAVSYVMVSNHVARSVGISIFGRIPLRLLFVLHLSLLQVRLGMEDFAVDGIGSEPHSETAIAALTWFTSTNMAQNAPS